MNMFWIYLHRFMNTIIWPPQAKIPNSATGFVVFYFLEYILIYFIKNVERERERENLTLAFNKTKQVQEVRDGYNFYLFIFFTRYFMGLAILEYSSFVMLSKGFFFFFFFIFKSKIYLFIYFLRRKSESLVGEILHL